MKTKQVTVKSGRVTTEGDDLVLRTCQGQYEGRHPWPQTPAGLGAGRRSSSASADCRRICLAVRPSLPAFEAMGVARLSASTRTALAPDVLGAHQQGELDW